MKVLVGSQTLGTLVEIEGSGLTPIEAQRNAVNAARGLLRIPDPVAIADNHKSAVIIRRVAEQKFHELVGAMRLNGNGVPFWRQREDTHCR